MRLDYSSESNALGETNSMSVEKRNTILAEFARYTGRIMPVRFSRGRRVMRHLLALNGFTISEQAYLAEIGQTTHSVFRLRVVHAIIAKMS